METKKKYKLTDSAIEFNGVTLYRIKALKDFSSIKAGDLGGWIEKEDNLSQTDNAWIGGDAKVCGNAIVEGNAEVFGDAIIYDNAEVYGNARIYDNAWVYGKSNVFGNARICNNAKVYGDARVHNHAMVGDNASVFDNARVYGNARIYGDAKVLGDVEVFGEVEICGNAVVCDDADYIVFKNFWSSKRYFTWTKSNNMWKVGCFYGTGKELIEKAYADSEKSGKEYEKIVRYVDSILAYK